MSNNGVVDVPCHTRKNGNAAADCIHRLSDNIIARDAPYHLGHARHYASNPLSGSFPWLPYFVIGSWGADIRYGYHLLLAPFTFIQNTTSLIDIAGVLTLAVLLVLFYLLTFFWLAILMGLVVLAVQLASGRGLSRLNWQVSAAGLLWRTPTRSWSGTSEPRISSLTSPAPRHSSST